MAFRVQKLTANVKDKNQKQNNLLKKMIFIIMDVTSLHVDSVVVVIFEKRSN